MKTSSNNNNIESKNTESLTILTGETRKLRCHYLSKRTDKPVSRVLTLERLSHPALTAAGVTAWAERFNDGVNSFDWLRVSIQLTEKICYTPNCTNVGLPDVENYGNLDYYMGQEGMMRVSMNNVDKFFQSIADKPAKMMTGEDWPNMAVIAAYKAAGRDQEADTLTAARDIYEQRREAEKEAWRKKYAAQQTYYNSPKPKNFSNLTELEKAQYMMKAAQECANEYPEMDWSDILEKAEKRLEKAQEWQEFLDREAEKQNSFAEGMRVTVPACSLTDGEAFVIVTIRRKAADNGGNASLTVKNETTGDVRNINGSDVQDILPPLEPASEITEAGKDFADTLEIKTGDRVLSKHFQTMGTVTGIYEWNGGTCYDVTLDKAVRGFSGETIKKTAFRRYGITKNYYPQGTAEIVCNAIYYAEELQAGFWGTDSKPRQFQFGNNEVEVFAPTDRRPSWLLVADIFSQPQEMTLQQVAEYLARRYQEANRLPEPPAEITISTDGEGHEPTLYERHDITAGEREAKTKGSASYIRRQAHMASYAFYSHKGARIETSIAYRNGTDDPDGMSYKVCWYDETRTGELHLVECENGISLEQAARHMADFSLLSECGLTLREILYPAA